MKCYTDKEQLVITKDSSVARVPLSSEVAQKILKATDSEGNVSLTQSGLDPQEMAWLMKFLRTTKCIF